MQIQSRISDDTLTLELKGRLDADWSVHVDTAIDKVIQNGHHRIALDLADVDYVSSAGVGVLIKYHRKLKDVKGSFFVRNATGNVLSVLRLMKLSWLTVENQPFAAPEANKRQRNDLQLAGCQFELYELSPGAQMECQLLGEPADFMTGRFSQSTLHTVRFHRRNMSLGLGTFSGNSSTETSSKDFGLLGESLGIAGAVIQHSADGSRIPDYQLAFESLTPELRMLYGIECTGDFSSLIRFDAVNAVNGAIPFSKLILEVHSRFKSETTAFVLVAESASIVGATLIQSPSSARARDWLGYPEIRDWLTFVTEQERAPQLLLIVGIAHSDIAEASPMTAFVRPLASAESPAGHFHAAQFRYAPLPKGMLDLHATVKDLFLGNSPQSVWHLLQDERPFEGAGETMLMRGACWCGPVSQITKVVRPDA